MDNLFFDIDKVKKKGKNVIIGKTVRIRYPELVEIGDNVIIDDFTYISTQLKLHSYVHISAGCRLIGGKDAKVEMKEFSTLAPNVVLSAGSDDYLAGLATPLVPPEFKGNFSVGEISIGKHCIIGSGSVILPNISCEDGACVGALTLVNKSLDAWYLYAGIPAKKLKIRDKDNILDNERRFFNS